MASNKIDCMIFSKDHPAQLDLLLRSINENFKELNNITILYKATKGKFLDGYNYLVSLYPAHNWIFENSINDIKTIVNSFQNEFTVFFVDDEVVVKDFSIVESFQIFRNNPDVHCVSLRLHPRINYCYTANLSNPPPKLTKIQANVKDMYVWSWKDADPRVDWGYPSCINSHLYPTEMIKYWINKLDFGDVNNLEGMFNHQRANFGPLMMCFEESKTINIANNLTQTGINRHGRNYEYSLDFLNDKFLLEGKRITLSNLKNLEMNSPTFEYMYTYDL